VTDVSFAIALAAVAVLYSAVGQAGGAAYVALLGLAGFAPDAIKPTAFVLNTLVSALGCIRFYRVLGVARAGECALASNLIWLRE